MELQQAIQLIQNNIIDTSSGQQWADLGCGTGLFTNALATLLHAGSTIYAIDKNISSFRKINNNENTIINPMQLDFVSSYLSLNDLDGVLMANSLHYVKHKSSFINKLSAALKATGNIIIVEYDTDKSNPWVPYPANFTTLQQLFKDEGFKQITKLKEHPSVFGRANIYSAIITK